MATDSPSCPLAPLWSIALLSALALALEVLLIRLFAIIQWHHFSYMIISLALLGYGASGTLLTLLGDWTRQHFTGFFVTNAVLFAVSAIVGFSIAQRLPFNALEIAWEPRQAVYLLILYLLLAVPFFCVANAIGLALMHDQERIHRIYAFDLTGAGVGALGVVLLLFALVPVKVLWLLGGLGLIAAWVAARECGWRSPRLPMILAGVALLGGLLPGHWMDLRPSPYKGLSQALQVLGAKPVSQHFGPLGMVTVVQNERIPFHYAPGLSLAAGMGPPEQLGLFSDGESLGAITRFRGSFDELTYLDYLTSALPYHLLHSPWVLVLGAGGGVDVLQALYHKGKVDAVELNPQVVELVRDEFAGFTGGLYRRKDVHVHLGEAREFVAASDQSYDLIQVATLGAFGGASAGLHALSENYLYTIEAFQDYLRHLNPEGMLAITRWLQLPPRDSLKLFATAVLALEGQGVQDPGKRLMLIRGWKTTTLVVKNGPFGPQDLEKLRIFCRERSFDVAYYPGMTSSEANRFNVLERAYLYEGALGILGSGRDDFLERYKFNLTPATDDRPYFSHFFKWRTLPELLVLRARAGLGQLEWGYLILVATLVQALLAGLVLILLPLWLVKIPVEASATGGRWRVPAYFIAIGLAFLFLEIAFIQKFILFLGNPLYAVAVVLCAFLVFAGLGSGYCQGAYRMSVTKSVMAIAVLALFYLLVLPSLFRWALAWPDPVKVCCAIVLIAPLAFFMGMPFPLGMAKIARIMPNGLPWAWGINGCASVVSAVLATLLAMAIGFSGVVASAVVLYLIAALVVPIGGRE